MHVKNAFLHFSYSAPVLVSVVEMGVMAERVETFVRVLRVVVVVRATDCLFVGVAFRALVVRKTVVLSVVVRGAFVVFDTR